MATRCDLGTGDVHQPSPVNAQPTRKEASMADLPTSQRNALPARAFALPATRQYPIHDAAHVRNAAARLEQNRRTLTPEQYAEARRNIAAAGRSLGVKTPYDARARTSRMRMAFSHPVHGHFEIQMRDGHEERLCRVMVALSDGATADGPVWIQIARCGEFRGHSQGAFSLTPTTFDEIVRNFTAVDLGQVAFDFEHASEMDPAEGAIPTEGAPAQGWIRQLDNRGQAGLWGLVEWLEPARTYVREKKYRFLSPAIRFNARHPETGKPIGARLTSVALTNRPFLRGMVPLMATDSSSAPVLNASGLAFSTNETMPRLRDALRLNALTSPAQCMEAVDHLSDLLTQASGDHAAIVQGVSLADYLPALRSLANLPTHSTWEQVFDAVRSLIHAAIAEHIVEEHGEEDEEPASMRDPQGATPMADNDLTLKLKDAEATVAKAQLDLAEATTRLSDVTTRLTAAEAKATALDAEVTRLSDALKARDEADLLKKVDDAFAVYKDKKGLTDGNKKAMAILARADMAAFDEMYPPVPADQRHLLSTVAPRVPATAAPGNAAGGTVPAAPSGAPAAPLEVKGKPTLNSLTDALRKANPKLSLADAQNQAARTLNLTVKNGASARR